MRIGGFLRAESEKQRRSAVGICAAMAFLSLLFAVFGKDLGPNVNPYLVGAALMWGFCDLLTAFLLYSQSTVSRRIDFGILASGYLLSGLLAFPYIGSYTNVLGIAPTLGEQQLPAAFFFTWHIAFPILAVLAVASRRRRRMRFNVVPLLVGLTVVFAAIGTVTAFADRDALPHFIIDGVFAAPYRNVAIPSLIVINAVGLCLVLLIRDRVSSLRVWLAVALFGSCLEGLLNLASPFRFSYAWDFSKIVALMTSFCVMFRMLYDIVRMYRQVGDIVSAQSGQAAARIRALWKIATSEGLSEDDHTQMVLDVAVGNVLSGRTVVAQLSHLDSGRIIIDAVARTGDLNALSGFEVAYEPGTSFGLDSDLHSVLLAEGRTVGWESPREIPSRRLRSIGAQSAIGTPIQLGPTTHFVVFASMDSRADLALSDMDHAFVEVVAANISQRFQHRSQRERIEYHLGHDLLTGLANRTLFGRAVRTAIANDTLAAVLLIDLDGFGLLNERMGQAACDELLAEIGAMLTLVDESDTVFRLGGDEFAVPLAVDDSNRSTQERAEAYREIFHVPFASGDRERQRSVPIVASIGAAEFQAPMTYDDVLTRANVALEEAQRTGGGKVTLYSAAMVERLQQRRVASDELIRAMACNEFFLEYQPTVELNSRLIAGAEALLRWEHPQRGRLGPGEFLDAATRVGLMGDVTHWVVRRLIDDLQSVTLPAGFRCYFNVPAQILEDYSFADDLAETMRMNPAIASRLGLEVTETDIMNQVERAIESLNSVRRLGLLVAVDDFGTGYSSMGYLKRLPIDTVKLDGSFIRGLPGDKRDENLAKLFLGITNQFSLVSVAEGIETEEQAQWLVSAGCMLGQGYLFSKPVSFAQLVEAIDRNHAPILSRPSGRRPP